MKRFVLLTTTRSGSTWLVDLLHQHPDVTMFGEMFHPHKRKWFVGSGDLPEYVEFPRKKPRPFSVFHYLDELYAASSQAVGFKCMYAYLRFYPELLYYLPRYQIAVIHLVRENLLDVVISHERMRQTGITHQSETGERVVWNRGLNKNTDVIYLDPDQTLKFMQKRERQVRIMRSLTAILPGPNIELQYEKLSTNRDEILRLYAFLGVSSESAGASQLKKIVTKERQDVILNWHELSSVLEKTPYRRFLE